MNSLEALERLERSSKYTVVGGRVLVRDARILAAVAALRAGAPRTGKEAPLSSAHSRTTIGV